MKSIFFRHSLIDIKLAARAAALIAGAHVQVRLRPIKAMRQWALPQARRKGSQDELLLAFRRATNRVPGTCLIRALALQRLLSLHGFTSELRIGVAPGPTGLLAHAWLLDDDRILIGGGREAETFTVLTTWSDAAVAAANRVR